MVSFFLSYSSSNSSLHLPHSSSLYHHSINTQGTDSGALARSQYSRKRQIDQQRSAYPFVISLQSPIPYPSDAAKALLAVKSLGRDPSGSEFLSSPENFSTLLSLSSFYKDDPEASSEALRCIANALLLIESSRETFLKPPVNGGDVCLNVLEVQLLLVNHCRLIFNPSPIRGPLHQN